MPYRNTHELLGRLPRAPMGRTLWVLPFYRPGYWFAERTEAAGDGVQGEATRPARLDCAHNQRAGKSVKGTSPSFLSQGPSYTSTPPAKKRYGVLDSSRGAGPLRRKSPWAATDALYRLHGFDYTGSGEALVPWLASGTKADGDR